MSKEIYLAPIVEIYEVAVEHGFAGSDDTTESIFEDPTENW